MLKKSIFFLSIAYTCALLLASLLNVNSITQALPSNSDKVLHTLAHVLLTGFWFLTLNISFNLKFSRALSYSAGFGIVLGIIIEVLQGTLTQSRVSDFNDFLANVLGTVIAIVLILGLSFRELKNK